MALTASEMESGGYVRDLDHRLVVVSSGGTTGGGAAGFPSGATPVTASSGNVANGSAAATLAAAAGKTTYISGFEVTGSGASTGLPVTVTVTGLLGGTASYTYTFVGGVLVPNTPLQVEFNPALPSSAVNTAIVVTCPAGGTGATNNTVVAHGFQL